MDAHKFSLAVADPKITEILDLRTGLVIPADAAIGRVYEHTIRLRMALRESIAEGSPLFACACCGVAVYLVSNANGRRFFFRHVLEDGRCTALTRGGRSEAQICASKFDGAEESWLHHHTKHLLAESMGCDSCFSDIKVETVVTGRDGGRRKPDVQAMFNGMRVAFEVQISTTFLRVIAERRAFYRREGGLVVWIFHSYERDSARLTQDDIFYNNNCNLFLASEETLKASRALGKFMLDCRWAEPYIGNGQLRTHWDGELVAFADLQIDLAEQRVFLFDYDARMLALRAGDAPARRRDFERFWLARQNDDPYDEDMWDGLRTAFAACGIALPVAPNWGGAPAHLLNALYSVREGRPVGWRFRRLVDVARQVATRHKTLLRALLRALDVYGRWEQIRQEDDDSAWSIQLEQCQPGLVANSPEYEAESRFDELVDLLFPELGGGGGNSHAGERF